VKQPTVHNSKALPSVSPWFSVGAGFLLFFMAGSLLRASDLPAPFTVNLPFAVNQATPVWLGHPETPQKTFATLNLPITPPDANASLLVTVFFQEKEGGFLRVTWQGTDAAQLLSDNFYEGIGMSNQRTLLITPEILADPGALGFQCGDTALGIQRIKLEWLENKNGLVSPQVQDILVTPATGLTQPAQNLDGQPKQADAAAWNDQLVTVPITDLPLRIEQGVEFSVQLDTIPGSGRLALKEAGLPLGQHLVVWINQKRAGTITPAVPDLSDDGYLAGTNPPDTYVGWRDGSFHLPVSFLKAGIDTVQFSAEDDAPAAGASATDPASAPVLPLAVKDVVLQLDYLPPAQDNSSAPSAPAASTPTEAVAPAPPPSTSSETNAP